MFAGALFSLHLLNCTEVIINESLFWQNDTKHVNAERGRVAMPLSAIALLLNAYSLYIFRSHCRVSVMRTCLSHLTCTEVILHLSVLLSYINALCGVEYYEYHPEKIPFVVFHGYVMLISDVCLCGRNWCNLIITLSRTEVVLLPLATSKRIFSRKGVKIFYALALGVALILAVVNSIIDTLVICQRPHLIISIQPFLRENYDTSFFENYVFFVFQNGLPVAGVLIFSIAIAVCIAPCCRQDPLSASNLRRRQNQLKATKTVLLLAFMFSIMEMPTLVFVSIRTKISQTVMKLVAEVLLSVDSSTNILIYMFGFKEFGQNLRYLSSCCGHAPWAQRLSVVAQHSANAQHNCSPNAPCNPRQRRCRDNGDANINKNNCQKPLLVAPSSYFENSVALTYADGQRVCCENSLLDVTPNQMEVVSTL